MPDPLMTRDLTKQRFERLVAIKPVGKSPTGHMLWLCQCDCGNTKEISVSAWGRTRSCGCLAAETTRARSVTHGQSHACGHTGSKTYQVWIQMRRRCREKKKPQYINVEVCARWEIFENFLADMGDCPVGMTIDREDPNGDYEPGNCRWATAKTQANNRRNNFLITHAGRTMTASQWSDVTDIQAQTIRYRINKGWSVEDALK